MNILLLFLPTYTYASFFNNYTSLFTYTYKGENCAVEPMYINFTDIVPCFSYQNISECCKHIMRENNFSRPLNICYNRNGNSSFSSCYEQPLSQQETTAIGFLTIMGILFVLMLSISVVYIMSNCFVKRTRGYESINR